MRIVIDLQGAQSASRHRGIGRYSLSFAHALVRHRGPHNVVLALNGLLAESIEPIRTLFEPELPKENIVVWNAPGPVHEIVEGNDARCRQAELLREAFLAGLRPDLIHLTSLFEGYGDDAVTSIGLFDTRTPTSVTLYDLIPLLNPGEFLDKNPTYARYYRRKVEHLRRAGLLLAISEAARTEALDALALDPARATNVGAASDGRFFRASPSAAEEENLRDRFGIRHAFVMYASATDPHKNHLRLIEAYARLPKKTRQAHQLVLVGGMPPSHRSNFLAAAKSAGLARTEIVITGHVTDAQMNALYNLSRACVLPSWHEGFGLPALEAMQCGKAVIASNTASLPEVVGREDALFDPFDVDSISRKLEHVLTDVRFREELERHAVQQAQGFTWENTALRSWRAMEALVEHRTRSTAAPRQASRKPRLAIVSPLPPERSGISDYSAELLRELSRHYDVETIVAQAAVADDWVNKHCPPRTVAWFRNHAREFDRIVYQFGNSPFHDHMLELLREHPGVVVLHDFFLSSLLWYREHHRSLPGAWSRPLLESHGYPALAARYSTQEAASVIRDYPANLAVLQQALGIIVHSEHARELARRWYGPGAADDWSVIPLLRQPPPADLTRESARAALGLPAEAFVVCAFGHLDSTKLNHRLIQAWLASPLARESSAHLVFVGENHPGEYGAKLLQMIQGDENANIRITGWSDVPQFQKYLSAADVGVQLRTGSRGETSASALDCMNYGLATIVNAHGSMAELEDTTVFRLPDEFTDEALIEALMQLRAEPEKRRALAARARDWARRALSPRRCAELYEEALEAFYERASRGLTGLVKRLGQLSPEPAQALRLAAALSSNHPPRPRRRQLLVDISAHVQTTLRTGIERFVRAVLREWLQEPLDGWQIEPVYAVPGVAGFRYARCFSRQLLSPPEGAPAGWEEDGLVEAWPGDVYFGLDYQPHILAEQLEVLRRWWREGVTVQFMVQDLLPVQLPQFFPEGAADTHRRWVEAITTFDGIITGSRAAADDVKAWLAEHRPPGSRVPTVDFSHHGADIANSVPSKGVPEDAAGVLSAIAARPTFLMVGTVEPRKGHLQSLAAFELLWKAGLDANLVIVGSEGWKALPDDARRTLPEIVRRLRTHPQLEQRLFWLEGVSDEYLDRLYAASTCLLAASEGEGFGLPLIEAARHQKPILARDLPVFREVAGPSAFYFPNRTDAPSLAAAVEEWLTLFRQGKAPNSGGIGWLTWSQSARRLRELVLPAPLSVSPPASSVTELAAGGGTKQSSPSGVASEREPLELAQARETA